MIIFFCEGLFTCFSAWIRWCVLKPQTLPPIKNQKTFLLSTLNPSFIDFNIFKFLRFWVLGTYILQMLDLLETRCSVWFAICYICMTNMTSLISFLSNFISLLSCFCGISAKNTTSNSLTKFFSVNHIQDGSFRECSRIGGAKMPTYIKSVTHILQWWN